MKSHVESPRDGITRWIANTLTRQIDWTFKMSSNGKLADALQGFLDKHDQDITDGNSCLEKLKSRSDFTIP